MKRIIALSCVAAVLCAGAWPTLRPERLARSEYADTEVSRCYPYDFTTKSADRLDIGVELIATATNCFVIEIGRDLNTNGWLEATESQFVIGWDAGRWIMKGRFGTEASQSGGEGPGTTSAQQQVGAGAETRQPEIGGWVFGRHESAEATTNTLKRMVWQAWPQHRKPVRLEATENGVPIFTEFATNAIPPWAWPNGWDTVKVTARGVDDPQERAKVHVMVNGTLIFVR